MEAPTDTLGPVQFGTYELDVRARELRSGATRIRLQEQPFEILRLMLERAGHVVTREELRHRLWPAGTYVDFEHSLNAAVKRLRAALGDDADNPKFVETLPRRGYRFIAPLGQSAVPAAAPGAPAAVRPRLAVLPFADLMTADAAQEYFSDGLTEEMIAQLGTLCGGRIGVIARWSSMVFKGTTCRAREIGEALRADYLLEGSVRREGDRVRITARLIETAGETHLWSETYERQLGDTLSVQADVAARIARSLATELAGGSEPRPSRTPAPAAYQAYLKGRYYWNKSGAEGLEDAVTFYQQALAASADFGAAHAALARAYIARAEYYTAPPRENLLLARAAARRSLELDPSLYEGHMAAGDTLRMLDFDWTGAEDAYRQAIGLNPSFESAHRSYAVLLGIHGRHAEAVRASERACELDPLCLVVGSTAAWVRFAAGDYDAVVEHCRNTLDMSPDFIPARRLLAVAYLLSGQPGRAITELDTALAATGADPLILSWFAHARAVTGAHAAGAELLAQARALTGRRHVSSYHLALAHTGLGDPDSAFAALDQAWLDRDPALPAVVLDPRFDPLRGDTRYAELRQRLGLG